MILERNHFDKIRILDKEPLIKLAMTRQENRHSRPGMDLVRDEVSYGVSSCITLSLLGWNLF